ncbi:MAG: hypothetical protein ACYCWE_06595 [Eubacteriales bacterium]
MTGSADNDEPVKEFTEEYDSLADAYNSDYFPFLCALDKLVSDIIRAEEGKTNPRKGIKVISKKCKGGFDENGDPRFIAEMQITDGKRKLYLQIISQEESIYSVSKESNIDKDEYDNLKFIKQYEDLDETAESKYFVFFCELDKMLEEYAKNIADQSNGE